VGAVCRAADCSLVFHLSAIYPQFDFVLSPDSLPLSLPSSREVVQRSPGHDAGLRWMIHAKRAGDTSLRRWREKTSFWHKAARLTNAGVVAHPCDCARGWRGSALQRLALFPFSLAARWSALRWAHRQIRTEHLVNVAVRFRLGISLAVSLFAGARRWLSLHPALCDVGQLLL
jgi:hypothetical protein